MFTLHCTQASGEPVRLLYSPHDGTLANADGTPVLAGIAAAQRNWEEAARVHPGRPGRKAPNPAVLKIQLGLACNYSCSYCSQASQIDTMALTRTADVQQFLQDLPRWLTGTPTRIEFWGGEPLLYFRKLEPLVAALDRRFPDTEFTMVTNGTLLTDEIVAFIARYDIGVTISHDGPGQPLRGADPFDDPELARLLHALWSERKVHQRMMFSSVLTAGNNDPAAIRRWFVDKLQDESVVTSLEGVVATHDDASLAGAGGWTTDQYHALRQSIAHAFESGDALRIPALREKAQAFMQSIQHAIPSSTLGQKCGMDRSDHVAVDLHSNVLTCQNTGANSRHGLGSALEIDKVRLDTSTHWAHRDVCSHCPVLQLCGGSCMYLDGDLFAQSCENEYQFGLGVLDGTLRRAFGLRLERIEGDVRRPQRRKVVRIATASDMQTSPGASLP